jgi:transcriptional regulator with XRE-family HTH domain
MGKNQGYNFGHQREEWNDPMPRKKIEGMPGFGARLAQMRKTAGYTQVELAAEIGVSQRNIAYYEGQTEHPPGSLLPTLAKALGVTIDELMGVTPIRKAAKAGSSRLQRRVAQIEKLDAREKRQILQFLDTFIERERLKRKAGTSY